MKTRIKAGMTAALASTILSIHAFGSNEGIREQCESQVAGASQGAQEMKFVSQRRFRDGTRIQYAVSKQDPETGYDTVRLAVCWLGAENFKVASRESHDARIADLDRRYESNLDGPLVEFLTPTP